ncbi:hypothetical protein BN8_p06890 (plasmid) [Fibrisoma limi BUZ 3]|uniref:Uncharacterized protein n=1 Tax=Fibrisoma limi BUZ 3 TaxID=1185876 RepID=I2GU80_9BACT|nr:hypothetical protein [Fibrisoma limi]CCH57681.1 hypothetical protein BN8_p06890 [Fibrisoma limi BUZ 3]
MAIARKVTKEKQVKAHSVDEKEIDALIEKGGSVTQANRQKNMDDTELKPILLKVPKSQVNAIDEELKFLPTFYRRNRTAYILQAIEEKVKRDKGKRK